MTSPQIPRRSLMAGALGTTALAALYGVGRAAADATQKDGTAAASPPWGGSRTSVYLVAHQDDELLFLGSQIRRQILQGVTVHVVLCTDGSGAPERTTVIAEAIGRVPSREELTSHRDVEFLESCRRLGVPLANRHIHSSRGTRITDGKGTTTLFTTVIREWVRRYPQAQFFTHSWVDAHHDHRSLGKALDEMHLRGELSIAPRFGFNPKYFTATSTRPAVTPPPLTEVLEPVGDSEQEAYRTFDLDRDRWAIGWNSVPDRFVPHRNDPTSFMHGPSTTWPSAEAKRAADAWITKMGGFR